MLLLSMMVINAVLELVGFFTWVGDLVIERASSPMKLLVLVTLTSGVLSALFINDPVVLMLTPLVCGVVLRLNYNPVPYLIALATAPNIGSVATITGNPQNILIGVSSQISCLSFLVRLGPVALVGMGLVVVVVRLFTGLFVVTGALEITGVSAKLFNLVSGLAYSGVAPLALVTAVLSNTISNVPAVLLFRPLILNFQTPPRPGLRWPVRPRWRVISRSSARSQT